jgi:predicted Zn-dependent protease
MRKRSQKKRNRSSRWKLYASVLILCAASISFILLFVWNGKTKPDRQTTAEAPSPEGQPSPAAGDQPRVIVDPSTFDIPAHLDADQQLAAREAVRLHSLALAPYWKGDLEEFERLASLAFDSYREADWIFEELGPFHSLLLNVWFEAGELSRALREGREWLERFPDSLDHLQTVGRLEFVAGHFPESAKYLKAFADQRPNSLVVNRQLARVYSAMGDKDSALAAVKRSLELIGFFDNTHESHAEVDATLLAAIKVTHRFYDYEQLRDLTTAHLKLHPEHAQSHMALGVAQRHLGNYSEAEQHLCRFLELADLKSANRNPVRHDLALTYMRQHKYRAAAELLAELLLDDPRYAKAYFQMGKCLTRLQRPDLAKAFTDHSRSLAPSEREERRDFQLRGSGQPILAARARSLSRRFAGDFAGAEDELRRALVEHPSNLHLRVFLADHYLECHQFKRASEEIDVLASHVTEEHPDVRGWRATCLAAERPGEAADILKNLCSRDDALPPWGLKLARIQLEQLREPAQAQEVLERLLQQEPNPTAQILLGRALCEQGEWERARDVLVQLSPSDHEWFVDAGGVWLALSRIKLEAEGATAARDLEAVSETARHRSEYYDAVAEWTEKYGTQLPFETLTADQARDRHESLKSLEAREQERMTQAARSEGKEAATHILEAARIRMQRADRPEALRLAQMAAYSDSSAALPWQQLQTWLDRPDEVFLRAEVQAKLPALGDEIQQGPTWQEILDDLLGQVEPENRGK